MAQAGKKKSGKERDMESSDAFSGNGRMPRREFLKVGVGAGGGAVATPRALGSVAAAAQTSAQTASQTSDQPWNAPPRGAIRPVSIDCHTHWAPEAYVKALADLGRPNGGDPLNFDLDRRRKWMDAHGVQMLVLTLNGGMPWQWVSAQQGARIAQIVNDAGIKAHTMFPDRFIVAVELPWHEPGVALNELNRVARKPGVRGVHLPNSIQGRDYLFEPAYWPLLARCEELGYPLVFHPLDGEINYYGGPDTRVGDTLSVSAAMNNWVGFTCETATTAAKFIVSGTLDKFPKLEIILPHSGGSFPYLGGRLEHGLERNNFKVQHPFKEYVRRFHFDSITFYPETLRFLIDLVGADRVVIGTDNAFGANQAIEYPNSLVEQLNLPAADRERVLRGNAARLFRL
jgi:aminocarboxymuconate-semialdehyde decarboxylase